MPLKKIFNKVDPIAKAKEVTDIVDGFTDDKGDKWERYETLLERQQEDREDARRMYAEVAQKLLHYLVALAIVYGFIYTLHILLPAIVNGKLKDIDPLAAGTLGVLVTLISTNISSIRDFLFGSSDSERETSKSLTQANNPLDRQKMKHEKQMARLEARNARKARKAND